MPAGEHVVGVQHLGYASRAATVVRAEGSPVVVDFRLEPRAIALEQLVVVGYGTQRREVMTGAVASISSRAFSAGPALDAGSLIAGRLPGLVVNTTSGDPRSRTEISLRGSTTLRGSRAPLVLIDGVPGSLETVAPGDIESIRIGR